MIHKTITIRVAYDEASVDDRASMNDLLKWAFDDLVGRGLLTPNDSWIVDEWACSVTDTDPSSRDAEE